ncbi:hypothetical protein AYO21_09541 [Fonsecaea monophora]|uniref:Uncharacterized protein n=1 Tax=Fonsecaea monophora TaxID=254056 RepID=A0A177EW09_9EURO|nr:hypothetical protein AYO21_09541 [Fonsecaea monophora]KAH0848891.1 hypothetical protein FOPE_03175 [Fonsecaea pedrosoi]OAG36227.1 hypothetical protein AYO21_09541 [Fonsecaea monophora]
MSSPQPTPTDNSQTEGRATPHDSTSQETHTQASEPIPQGEQDGESGPESRDLVNVALLCRLTPGEVQALYTALLNEADPEAAELEGVIPHFIFWTSDRDGGPEALYQRRHEPEEQFYVDRAGVADCTLIITENYEGSLIGEASFRDELWPLLKDTRNDYDDYDDVDDGLLDAIAQEAMEHCVIYGRIPCGGFRSAWANLSISNQWMSEIVEMYGGEVEVWRAATWNMETFYREGERKFREAGGILYQEIMDYMGSDEEEQEGEEEDEEKEKAEESAFTTQDNKEGDNEGGNQQKDRETGEGSQAQGKKRKADEIVTS